MFDEDKEITYTKILTIWNQIPYFNYFSHNLFFFTLNPGNANINSAMLASLTGSHLVNFFEYDDSLALAPTLHSNFYLMDSLNENFLYLRKSTFINFFIDNMIDVPICFKKSASLKTKNFELPILKFLNFLMKKGKREKLFSYLFKSMRLLYQSFKIEKIMIDENTFSWLNFFFFTNTYLFHFDKQEQEQNFLICTESVGLRFKHQLNDFDKTLNEDIFIKGYILKCLSCAFPIFSYFIYSVDKNIRKFSRGKSGKYTFIWKYIAPYKRLYLTMRWIAKDIKFYQSKKFKDRLIKTFLNLAVNPEKSFAWKSKIFSHNYVFKNFKKSLMSSFRTTL